MTLWFLHKAISQYKLYKTYKETKPTKVTVLILTYYMVFYKVSILGPLLINIYISDMFYDIDNCNISSYAEGNTPCTITFKIERAIQKLELITDNLFECIKRHHVKAYAEMCHLLFTRDFLVTSKIG